MLDALEEALCTRQESDGLFHHSDGIRQYLSIRYTGHLAQAHIDASVGCIGNK
ncbi:hypothetical protein [Nitrosomonas supralitoralis]|uniref:hypothetical protein n=1 Tax=Nitrosomonas supralitoralis TaxID=2116706 RepID=UPI0015584659|nr:hypothetical protein [Nitrosomonas supralitoralis]